MSEQNLISISEPPLRKYLTLCFEVKNKEHLVELLSLDWCQRSGNDAISERDALSKKVSDLEIAVVGLIRTNLRNLRKVAQLSPPITLSQALAGIDTEIWAQNNTIDQAAKALVEQWHLICNLTSMVQPLLSMAKEADLGGLLVDEIEAAATKAHQVLTQA